MSYNTMCKALISLTAVGMAWSLFRGHALFFTGSALSYIAVWIGLLLLKEGEPWRINVIKERPSLTEKQ